MLIFYSLSEEKHNGDNSIHMRTNKLSTKTSGAV